jgi:alkylation response protein AidB-like acyl-CoA dehydrogenase
VDTELRSKSVKDTWSSLLSSGWHAIDLTESDAGVVGALVAEQAAAYAAPLNFTDHCLAARAALQDADGRTAGAAESMLWTVAGVDSAVDDRRVPSEVTAVPDGRGWSLSGSLSYVSGDSSVDGLIVAAKEAGSFRPMAFAVRVDGALKFEPVDVVDMQCRAARVDLDRLSVGPAESLDDESIDRLCMWGTLGSCAELLGSASTLLQMTVNYAKSRTQFGKPIGSFQAVKHHCANMHVSVEAMRAAVWNAACSMQASRDESATALSIAKSYCAPSALGVGQLALQVHGGIGFTWEYPLHTHLKRIMRLSSAYGDARWHRERLATKYLGPAALEVH